MLAAGEGLAWADTSGPDGTSEGGPAAGAGCPQAGSARPRPRISTSPSRALPGRPTVVVRGSPDPRTSGPGRRSQEDA